MNLDSSRCISTPGAIHRNQQRLQLVLLYCLIAAPWVAVGVIGALQPTVNSPLDWVDSSFEPRKNYDEFRERFGAGDAVIISWPGCTIDQPLVDRFTGSLRRAPGFYHEDRWLFRRVLSGREAYLQLAAPPIGMPRSQAVERLSSSLIGPDGVTTCVAIFFTEEGLQQRSRLVPLIRAAASRFGEADRGSLHLVGPIMDGYTVDQASQLSMQRLAPLSSIVALCVCVLCLDGLFTAILVFGIACAGQGVALSIIHYSGGSMSAPLIVIPPLVQVLAISGGVHFVNYYRTASTRFGSVDAIGEALRLGAVPCILSAATTAIGLASLAVSGLSVVREFGMYAAMAVLANSVLLLSVLPGLLGFAKSARASNRTPGINRSGTNAAVAVDSSGDAIHRIWHAIAQFQNRFGTIVSVVSVATMVVLGAGVVYLQASVRIETLFARDNRLIEDYRWIEQYVGAMVPIETVVHFDKDSSYSPVDRVAIIHDLESRLRENQSAQSVTSCLDFLPIDLASADPRMASFVLEQCKPLVQQSDYFRQDESGEHWRLTSHFSALDPLHYGDLLENVNQAVSQAPAIGQPGSGASVRVSGLMPLVHGIQSQLLKDLFASFLTAFLLIAMVMTISESGIVAGLISMVPNIFPTLSLFGILGWLGASIDIGTVMTASVAMGIAVDDTLHFLSVFKRQLDRGESRLQAVESAYRECGGAMIQTTLICGSGLAIFAFSDFVPTSRFAWMMVSLLATALLGDLLVLPALLLSPIGKAFELSGVRSRWSHDETNGQGSEVARDALAPSNRLAPTHTLITISGPSRQTPTHRRDAA